MHAQRSREEARGVGGVTEERTLKTGLVTSPAMLKAGQQWIAKVVCQDLPTPCLSLKSTSRCLNPLLR